MNNFRQSNPVRQGVIVGGIIDFIDALEADQSIEPHGLIITRHGERIAEGYWSPHRADRSRLLYSLSKTFTGTALGLQTGEGRLGLDDLVSDYLPECFVKADEQLKKLTIRHIASMSTGHDAETLVQARGIDPENIVRGFLQIPPATEPGKLFAYNQPPVLALATILQRLAGERLVDYLRPRLFEPLGMKQLSWYQSPNGLDPGYTGLYANLDAIAKLGQLYLDDGLWQGQRILPEGWVAEASKVQVANPLNTDPDWQQGYGIQLWRSRYGYRGDGAFGQYMVVLPEYDATVALFSCTQDMQKVLNLMWEHLLPAMSNDIAESQTESENLVARLGGLTLPTAQMLYEHRPLLPLNGSFLPVSASSGLSKSGSSKSGSSNPNEHRTITVIEAKGDSMVVYEGDSSFEVRLSTRWLENEINQIAASAATCLDGTTAVELVFLATPHRLQIKLDPVTTTFTSVWTSMPLFGVSITNSLAGMQPPI